ncbi:MAG: hypothetical protein ABSB42_02760 [Tepidisphaeraceae bacterium]|jgi:hypothetical protein
MNLFRRLFGNGTQVTPDAHRRDLSDDEILRMPVDQLRLSLERGLVGAHFTVIICCYDKLGRSPEERGTALESVYPQMLAMCNDRKRYLGYFTGMKKGRDIEIAIASRNAKEQFDIVSTSVQFARTADGVRFQEACKELIRRVGFNC